MSYPIDVIPSPLHLQTRIYLTVHIQRNQPDKKAMSIG